MKAAIDSSDEDKAISKEKFNLVGLDDLFPNKPLGYMVEICICANYKILYGLQQGSSTTGLWPVRNQAK